VRTGCFKNHLDVDFWQSGATLEKAFGGCQKLLVRYLNFLPGTAVVGHRSEAMRMVLLPLLSALRAHDSTSDGGIGGCGLATTDGRTCVNQSEGDPDSLFN
jgi:hypothetical protein